MASGISKELPIITVIVGTKNRPKLILRAVDSILRQTYSNLECIIVDCSNNDETKDLVKGIDERVNYFRLSPDPGRIESLTFGINQSKGEFITFLDDDDEYMPTKLERQLNVLGQSKVDVGMVYCWTGYFDEENCKHLYYLTNNIEGYVFNQALEKMAFCSFPTMMFKRESLLEIGLTDEVGYPSDWLFVARFTQKYHVVYVPEVLVKVNINHYYDRMSAPRIKDADYLKKTIDFHAYFYSLFEYDYKRNPRIAMVHLYPLISVSAYLKHYSDWWKYSIQAIRLNPFCFTTHIKIIRSLFSVINPFMK